MNFRDMLGKISQLSESTKEVKGGKVHTADKGGYGRKDDDESTSGDAPKAGKDAPKGDIFGRTSGKVPDSAKTAKEKKGLKEYFNSLDKALNEMDQPIPVLDQGNKQAGVGVITSKNPAIQKMLSQLSPQDMQIVMKGQQGQTQPAPGQPQQQPSATSGGATNQPAMAEEDEGKPGKNFAKIAKSAAKHYGSKAAGERVAGAVRAKLMKSGKIKEGDIPPQDGIMGAGLGAGRNQGVAEGAKPDFLDVDKDGNKKESFKKAVKDKKKVKESMDNRLKAAHHEGKAHGLTGKPHCGKNYDDMEEARMYHEGYKQGLDECHGQVPIQGLIVADESAQGTVDDMASFGADTPEIADEGNAFTRALAKTPQGGKFALGGKSFTDNSGYDAKVFESWDNQLHSLLDEYQEIQEGLSVSVSKGQQGAPDSVSVTAQDADADKLLQLVKHAGLGLFGEEGSSEPTEVGDQQHGGLNVVGDHDGMMALMRKAGGDQPGTLEPAGDSEGYADEEGQEDDGGLGALKQLTKALGGGTAEEESDEEEVDEDGGHIGGPSDESEEEYMDQEEETVAEDNPPDTGAAEFGEIDAETAEDNAAASSHGGAQNSNLEEDDEEEEDLEESYANSDDDGFEADIDFMTKIISGGLNKQKSTGQTTIPVIAGQNDREGYSVNESVSEWKKLAGLK